MKDISNRRVRSLFVVARTSGKPVLSFTVISGDAQRETGVNPEVFGPVLWEGGKGGTAFYSVLTQGNPRNRKVLHPEWASKKRHQRSELATGQPRESPRLAQQGRFLLAGRELTMKAGDLLVAPDGVPHGVTNTGTGRLLVLAILAPPR